MSVNRNQLLALGVALGLVAWVGSGVFGEKPVAEAPKTEGEKSKPVQRVRVVTLESQEVGREVVIHGTTAPARRVILRAETEGRVVALGAERGAAVESGQSVVRLEMRDREARLRETRSLLTQRELEYRAAQKLGRENLRAESQVAEALALLEAARAGVRAAELDAGYAQIAAPLAGRLERRPVEVGDYVAVGDEVAEVVELAPLIVTGQATEQEVTLLRRGLGGRAELVTGQSAEGVVRYVAATADAQTRTFTVEAQIPNADQALPAGVTAVLRVEVARLPAHYLSAALLSLDDAGALGVKVVDEQGVVRFLKAQIVRADAGGVWLAGLPQRVRVITVGQGFVTAGQKVEAVEEARS